MKLGTCVSQTAIHVIENAQNQRLPVRAIVWVSRRVTTTTTKSLTLTACYKVHHCTVRKIAFTAHQMYGQRSSLKVPLPPRSKAVKAVCTRL